MCDANEMALGVVLGQKNFFFHLIYYESKALDRAQKKYTIRDQELLAVVYVF